MRGVVRPDMGREAREAARVDHLAWLAAQRQSRRDHRKRLNKDTQQPADDGDYLLQAEQHIISTGARPPFLAADEESMPSHASRLTDDRLYDEEIIAYRSLSMPGSDDALDGDRMHTAFLSPEASEREDDESESDASWLAEGHPPLLKRQRAFEYGRVDDLSAFVFA